MRNPIVIAVAARRGGVGKTSIATATASLLAQSAHSVLFLDLDTQGTATLALGGDPAAPGSAPFLQGEECVYQQPQDHLKLLAGSHSLSALEIQGQFTPGHLASRVALRDEDYVVIDTAPGPSSLSRSALEVADIVLAVTEPHPLSLPGAAAIICDLEADQHQAVVLSRLDHRRALHRNTLATAESDFGTTILSVRQDVRFESSFALQQPAAMSRRTRAIEDIESIVNWIYSYTPQGEDNEEP